MRYRQGSRTGRVVVVLQTGSRVHTATPVSTVTGAAFEWTGSVHIYEGHSTVSHNSRYVNVLRRVCLAASCRVRRSPASL